MLDKLHSLFSDGALQKVGCITAAFAHVMDLLDAEFDETFSDKKNQAIDALIEILNREKSV